ncbi:phosphatase PAP2 family protein [Micromonospora sp. NPDC003197]
MLGRRSGLTIGWLVLLLIGQILALGALWRFAVHTRRGQLLDTIALTGNTIGQQRIDGLVDTVLSAMSVVSLLAATAVIGFIALIRSRIALAVATTLLIAGANVTTQVLKYSLYRPDLGVDPDRAAVGNTLPSGHTTVAASVAVALVLVLPPRVRGWGALVAAGYAALAGVATLSAGWHRPSDAAAALLVVGGWAALAGILLLFVQGADAQVEPGDKHRVASTLLVLTGVVLLAVAAVALDLTGDVLSVPPEQLSRRRLFVAYAGSAAGIAGVAGLLMALVLTTVHRVVPRYTG